MRKQKFFDSDIIIGKEDKGASNMDFSQAGIKTLNDLAVLRMLFLDHFFLLMGMNKQIDGSPDPN